MNSSNQSLDLRVRRTYKFLWDALLKLMMEHDFEAITVTDICEHAMVHRTTFYKHYTDKYELLSQGIQDQLHLYFDGLNLPAGKPAEMTEKAETLRLLIASFEHVLGHERFYRLMLCGEGVGTFYTQFRKVLVEQFLQRSAVHQHRNDKKVLMRGTLRAFAHAGLLISTFAWWLENDCPYTPTEMGEYLWEDSFQHESPSESR